MPQILSQFNLKNFKSNINSRPYKNLSKKKIKETFVSIEGFLGNYFMPL